MIDVKLCQNARRFEPNTVVIGVGGDHKTEIIKFILPETISGRKTDLCGLSVSIVGEGVKYASILTIDSDFTTSFDVTKAITRTKHKEVVYKYSLKFAADDFVHITNIGIMKVKPSIDIADSSGESIQSTILESIQGRLGDLGGRVSVLEAIGGVGGQINYETLKNIPQINSIPLLGNRNLPEQAISNLEIKALLK